MAELLTKYQQYEEYKYSGLAWLGYMPSHWVLRKSKYLFNRMQRPVRPEDGVITAFRDGQVTLRTNRRTDGFTQSIKEIGYQSVRIGDLLVHAMDGFAGAIGVSDSDGKCSPVCSVCVPVNPDQIYMPYYGYLVRQLAVTDFISSLAKGIRERSTEFRYSEFSALDLAVPTLEEQTQIANFLNHETAQIDTLIEKQQTLIQLLKEKRQAVISHAVTKGLNPDAPMKDSGVEWLGEVPEHWSVIKLSNYAIPLNGDRGANYPSGNDFVDEGVFFISTSEVVDGYIKTDTASKITLKKYNQLGGLKIKKGDIIYCLRGSVGKSGICTFNEGTISSSLMGIRSVSIEPYYLKLLLASSSELQQRSMLVTGSVSANLSAQNVMGYRFAIPEKVEQLMIIAHVENSLEKIDILLSKATQAIQLMQERRIALISAAVTGKIDVRGWRASE